MRLGAVERLRPQIPNVLVKVRDGPFPSNVVPAFLKLPSTDCPAVVRVHQLEHFEPLLIGKRLFATTFCILRILFVVG